MIFHFAAQVEGDAQIELVLEQCFFGFPFDPLL